MSYYVQLLNYNDDVPYFHAHKCNITVFFFLKNTRLLGAFYNKIISNFSL